MKLRKRKPDINLEVLYDAERAAWVVRVFGGDPNKVFDVWHRRIDAEYAARGIARAFATVINADGSCEVHVRNMDGTFGDPSTYGRDPEASKG